MKKILGLTTALIVLALMLGWTGAVQAGQIQNTPYTVTGDVTSGWGTTGGSLWYDVMKESASSTAGGYDDGTTPHPTYGVLVRPPTTIASPNPINPTNHNWVEVDYFLVTGEDGHRVLYSVGELDPRFGNKPATLTSNKDKKDYDLAGAGRELKKIRNIEVVHAFTHIKGVQGDVHPYSPMLVVSGAGATPRTFKLADLQAMPQVTFDASSSTSNTVGIWRGPRLVDVLKGLGIDTSDVDSYIIVQATDGYSTLVSMYEATHKLGLQDLTTGPNCQPEYALLAIKDNSASNTINNGATKDNGLVRLVLPGDQAAGRWVSNTAQIIVFNLGRDSDHWQGDRR